MALIKCPECGNEISDKASACPNCGCPASEWSEITDSKEPERCPYCGSENIGEDGYCEECGMKIEQFHHEYETFTPNNQKNSKINGVGNGKSSRCIKCGSQIPVGANICPNCGYSYGESRRYQNNNGADIGANNGGAPNKKRRISKPLIILIIVIALICLETIAQIMGDMSLVLFGILILACMVCFPVSIIYLIVCAILKKDKAKAYGMIIGSAGLFVIFMLMASSFLSNTDSDSSNDDNVVQVESQSEMDAEEVMGSSAEIDVNSDYHQVESNQENVSLAGGEKESLEPSLEYVDVFDADLKENWSDYVGLYIRTTFEVGRCEDDYIESSYENGYLKAYPDNYREFEYGDFVTITGYVTGEVPGGLEIMDAHIESYGSDAEAEYSEKLSAYNERKAIEAEKREAEFKEEAEEVSYDDLSRYPDTYKDRRIKVTVKITDVEPDGIIFSGHYEAVINGTSNKVAVYDEREVKEPKLLDGDVAVIYGYGDGLTTVKVQDTSGLIPKTVDEYTIPGINIEYVEVQ